MSDELKPCPFCGSEVKLNADDSGGYSIECGNHDWPRGFTQGIPSPTIAGDVLMCSWGQGKDAKQALIEAWNTRADDAPERTVDNQADSRERLEEAMHNVIRDALLNLQTAIMQCMEQGMDVLSFDEGEFVDYEHDEYVGEYLSRAMRLLDRQAAITERELCSECGWPAVAAQPDRELQDRMAELEADNERLRDVARKQAESFKGIEAELAKANSTCNTLRASVAGLKGTVERQRDELAEAHGLLKELYDLAATGEFEFDDMYRFSRTLGRLGIEVS